MLSYLHGFHAGNQADVFKHGVLTLLLEALMAKPKPLVYVESHAGAGVYELDGEQAGKTAEFMDGIARLWPRRDEFPELSGYFEAISDLNPEGGLARYPGSPWVARHALRADDRLILMELHKTEVATLRARLSADPRIHIHHRDGFEGLVALLPPKPPRGLVLIDPPYELTGDYARVASALEVALSRWPTAVYAIWYPRLAVQRDQAELLLKRLSRIAPRLLVAELAVRPQSDEFGMHGSGMALVNPPWQFEERLGQWLPRLARLLASEGFDLEPRGRGPLGWRLEWLAGGGKGA